MIKILKLKDVVFYLRVTKGLPFSILCIYASLSFRHKSSSIPTETLMPASLSFSTPFEATIGFGSTIPTTTRLTPARINDSVQGGVLP